MYNLLMSGTECVWDNPTWVIPSDRFLEYTHPAIKDDFKSLTDDVILRLKSLPTLFCYEQYIHSFAKVGQITAIERRYSELKITFSINTSIPYIPRDFLLSILPSLDVDTTGFEVNRTHWAVKDSNLIQVLKENGIVQNQTLLAQPRPPKVFITYSWDSPEHKQWVAWLGGRLRENGVDVSIDQWNIRGGEDMSVFMERSIRESDRVLVICTEQYYLKAKERTGGVGYESALLTSELMENLGTTKFIPVIRQASGNPQLPDYLRGRYFFNLSDGQHFKNAFDSILRELHNSPIPIPPLGINPFI